MTRELAIIIGLVFLVVRVTTSDYAGLSFQLTRLADDKFKNPTTKICDWQEKNRKFCTDTNSRCDQNCCQCTCDYQTSTFDRSTMKCRNNDELRSGCKAKFDGKYVGSQIQLLDLSKKRETNVYWPVDLWTDEVKSFDIISITSYHDGSGIKTKFLNKKGKPKKRGDGNWQSTIKWDKVSKENYGNLFRVNISYAIERTLQDGRKRLLNENDCFVFKSSGSITMTFPSPPLTTSPPLITKKSTSTTPSPITIPPNTTPHLTKEKSTSTTPSPITITPKTPSTKTKPLSKNTPSTPTPRKPTYPVEPPITTNEIGHMTTQIKESKETRKPTESTDNTDEPPALTPGARKEGDGGGNDATTVSLAVVGCLLLLVAVVLVVLWTRRRSAKASKEKNKGAADADGSVDNPLENIYAEADTSINYPQKDKNNHVYEYAKGNLESNYTSLDMSKVDQSKPTYESLVNVQSNMYEQIPVNCNASGASGVSGQTPIAEPFYHVVDTPEGAQDPGQIYHNPDNCETRREIPGRTGDDNPERVYSTLEEEEGAPDNFGREVPGRTGDDNPERVYSTLEEEEDAPENFGREVPGRTGDDNPERIYSVLEDEAAESDYLTILPGKSDYEQPINPPMSDA